MSRLQAYHIEGVIEAGCDEAGRGCLAGPVVAAAVILPEAWDPGLNDSKQLTESRRASLREEIESGAAIWAVGMVDHKEIDEINILNASFLAMHRALEQLKTRPEHILVDGNRFHSWQKVPHTCMVKGDSRFLSIAAASILAKTHRDQYMQELHERYPAYGWDRNKGYPTSHHREAIREFGPSPFHRMSFTLLPEQLSLF